MEEEDMDEDVFIEENLIDEDELILRDMQDREALATRLEKWKRPALSTGYQSQSENIGNLYYYCCCLTEISRVLLFVRVRPNKLFRNPQI